MGVGAVLLAEPPRRGIHGRVVAARELAVLPRGALRVGGAVAAPLHHRRRGRLRRHRRRRRLRHRRRRRLRHRRRRRHCLGRHGRRRGGVHHGRHFCRRHRRLRRERRHSRRARRNLQDGVRDGQALPRRRSGRGGLRPRHVGITVQARRVGAVPEAQALGVIGLATGVQASAAVEAAVRVAAIRAAVAAVEPAARVVVHAVAGAVGEDGRSAACVLVALGDVGVEAVPKAVALVGRARHDLPAVVHLFGARLAGGGAPLVLVRAVGALDAVSGPGVPHEARGAPGGVAAAGHAGDEVRLRLGDDVKHAEELALGELLHADVVGVVHVVVRGVVLVAGTLIAAVVRVVVRLAAGGVGAAAEALHVRHGGVRHEVVPGAVAHVVHDVARRGADLRKGVEQAEGVAPLVGLNVAHASAGADRPAGRQRVVRERAVVEGHGMHEAVLLVFPREDGEAAETVSEAVHQIRVQCGGVGVQRPHLLVDCPLVPVAPVGVVVVVDDVVPLPGVNANVRRQGGVQHVVLSLQKRVRNNAVTVGVLDNVVHHLREDDLVDVVRAKTAAAWLLLSLVAENVLHHLLVVVRQR
mmetsp:Transcript_11007/g.33472  ORF Transcript_11007/g.33472 Transcript_11007/m.33472 type:complete len:582 (-) Transcript_11007:180-1925(-)